MAGFAVNIIVKHRGAEMQKRKFLLSTVLGGTMLFFLTTTDAYTKTTELLKPQGSWSVSKLASSGSTGQSYCAMARRHDQNAILTFAQNTGDKSSLAVDFQKNILNRDNRYDVTLKAGSFEERTQAVKPVSQSAFVMKLGHDPVFYDALKTVGVLTVSVNGDDYTFDMNGYAKAQEELNVCVASLSDGKPQNMEAKSSQTATRAATASAAPQAVTSSYVDPGVVDSLRRENNKLRAALETERREFEDRFMREGGGSRTAELVEKVEILEKQNADLQKRISSQASQFTSAQTVPEKASLSPEQLAELASLKKENQSYKAQIADLETRVVGLAKTAATAKQAAANAVAAPVDITASKKFEDEKSMLESRLSELELAVSTRDEELLKLRQAMAAQKAQSEQVATADKAQQARIAELQSALAATQSQQQARITELETALAASGKQESSRIAELEAALAASQTQMQQQAQLLAKAQMDQSSAAVRSVEESQQEQSALAAELAATKAMVAEKEQMISSLNTTLEMKDQALQLAESEAESAANNAVGTVVASEQGSAHSVYQKKISDLEAKLAKKEEELWQAKSKILAKTAKNEPLATGTENAAPQSSAELEQAQRDLALYKEKVASLQKSLSEQQIQLSAMENSDDPAAQSAHVASMAKTIETMREEAKSKDEHIATMEAQLTELQAKLTDNDQSVAAAPDAEMSAELSSLQQAVQAKDSEIADLKTQITDLNARIVASADQQSGAAEKEAQIIALTAQVKAVSNDLMQAQNMIQTMDRDFNVRKSELEDTIRSQSAILAEKEQEKSDLQISMKSEQQKIIEELKLQVADLRLQNERLQDEADSSGIDTEVAENALESMIDFRSIEADLEAVLKERNALAAELESIQDAKQSQRVDLAQGNWEFEKATVRYNEAERQIKRLGDQLEKSKSQCVKEKKVLEYQLFDPEVTKKEQTVRFISLEKDLAAAREALRKQRETYEQQIAALESKVRGTSVARASAPVAAPIRSAAITPAPVSRPGSVPSRVARAPIGAQPAVTHGSVAPQPVAASASTSFASPVSFSQLLQSNGVSLSSPVQVMQGSGPQMAEYAWRSGQVNGNSEQQLLTNVSQYGQAVKSYLAKKKSACHGDFASVPVSEQQAGDLKVSSYDVACVGNGADMSSSVLFYNHNGVITAIAHEAGLENMDEAMDIRDRIASGVLQGKVASR